MPVFGTAHNLAVVSIDRRYRGQAHKVAQGLWGAGQMMFNKYLVITGEDCDVHDPDRLAALLRRAEFPRDLIVSEGVYDVLDHATATPGFGGKLAFDLTEIDPSAPAEAVRLPERFELTPGLVEVADGLAGKWGPCCSLPTIRWNRSRIWPLSLPEIRAGGFAMSFFSTDTPGRCARTSCCGSLRPIPIPGGMWSAATVCCARMPGASGPALRATLRVFPMW